MRIENPFTGFKTTEIHVTSELATLQSPNASNLFSMPDKKNPVIDGKGYDQYSVAIGSTPLGPGSETRPPMTPRAHSTVAQRNNRAAMEANRAAFGYTKVALLFFVSLLVTWVSSPRRLLQTKADRPTDRPTPAHKKPQVPSSTNRVYSVIHPSLVSLPTIYATGVVLPLMGFWNAVIYTTTSWQAVRLLFSGKLKEKQGSIIIKRNSMGFINNRPSLGTRKWTGAESDSLKGLAVGHGSGYGQV